MQKNRRTLLTASVLAALGIAIPSSQALAADLVPGRDYVKLPEAHPTQVPGKIEVIEFFSYGCGHCNDFHPYVKEWSKNLPADVNFRRIPVVWNAAWGNLARLFYTLEALGELSRLDDAVFTAIHGKRQRIFDEASMSEWFVSQGGNAKKFSEAFNSIAVTTKLKQADEIGKRMRIESVPTVIVDGQYLVRGTDFKGILANTDALVARLRKK